MDQAINSHEILNSIIKRWIIWFRLRRALSVAIFGLSFGLAITVGFSMTILGQANLVLSLYILLSVTFSMSAASIAAVVGYFWSISPENITRFFDRYFTLFDRMSTARELSRSSQEFHRSKLLVEKQRDDTIAVARLVEPNLNFFLTTSRFQVGLILALVSVLVIVGFLSKSVFKLAKERQIIRQVINQEIQELESLNNNLTQNELLTAQQRLELTRELDQAIRKLENAKNLEQAVAAMQETESALQTINKAALQQQASDLRQSGQQLLNRAEGSSGTPLNEFAQYLAAGNLARAAQELKNLNVDVMGPIEKDALVDQLEQAAQNIVAANPELAGQFQNAAQALRQGDVAGAQQELGQAAQALNNTASHVAQANTAQQMTTQISQGRTRLLQAGQSILPGLQPGDGANQGTGQNSRQANAQGSGNSFDPNAQNVAQGSGAGRGSSIGSEAQGSEVDSIPIDQSNAPGDGGVRLYEEVFAPKRLGGSMGEDVTLPPSNVMDQILSLSGANPGNPGPSKVPFQELSPKLVDAYRNFSNRGEVPPSLREIIKAYYYNMAQP